jgi:hypothetical protein
LLARQKSVTRRDWTGPYAAKFREGELVQAFDRNPRFGGKQVAVIRLTQTPYLERTSAIPEEDWQGEGFEYLQSIGAKVDGLEPRVLWKAWKLQPQWMWVVRFEVVEFSSQQPPWEQRASLLQPSLFEAPGGTS